MHSSKHTAVMFLLGALLAGGAAGFSVERFVLKPGRVEPQSTEEVRNALAETLDLSADQRARYDAILAARDARIDTLMAPINAQMDAVRPRYRAIRDSARGEIRALLSAAQQRQFDAYVSEMRAKEAKRDSTSAARRRRSEQRGAPRADAPRADERRSDD